MAQQETSKDAELSFDVTRDVIAAYATPIVDTTLANCAALNARLRAIVLAKEAQSAGVNRSNIGGWQSDANLFEAAEPEIKTLVAHIDTVIRQTAGFAVGTDPWKGRVGYRAWANVNRRGDYNRMHNHPGAHWSGIYYVDTGAPAGGGDAGMIEFQDPRGFVQMLVIPGNPFHRTFKNQPVAGQILLFPGFLKHFVYPHDGESERISIAFNAYLGTPNPGGVT